MNYSIQKIFGSYSISIINDDTAKLYDDVQEDVIKIIKELEQENQQLKERIVYLERSNDRREDTIRAERDENIELSNKIDKVVKLIEDDYYSKNTTDIDSIGVSSNKLIQVRKILKGDVDGR